MDHYGERTRAIGVPLLRPTVAHGRRTGRVLVRLVSIRHEEEEVCGGRARRACVRGTSNRTGAQSTAAPAMSSAPPRAMGDRSLAAE